MQALSYRGHVEFEDGYAATRLRRKPRVQVLSEREREGASSASFVFHSFAQRNTFLVFSFFPLTEHNYDNINTISLDKSLFITKSNC